MQHDAVAQIPERLYSLDVLRGVASLAVVFWHWQHFFYDGTQSLAMVRADLPLYALLSPLYNQGWLGVDFFFCLSGFIFYWLYSRAVAERAISARDFFWLRFSRLYPLHFATLVAVAVGQLISVRMTGGPIAYGNNDAYHFVLNLLFAPAWGLERGPSFNGPAWSVSVEVALYALFFALCRTLPVRAPVLLATAAAGLLVLEPFYLPFGRGISAFFVGGATYLAYRRIVAARRVDSAAHGLPWLAGGLWLLIPLVLSFLGSGSYLAIRVQLAYVALLVFPATILAFALVETRRGRLLRGAAFLGDAAYSTYLLHFPLQMLVLGAVGALGLERGLFYSPWALAGFIAALLAVSFASHRLLEMPAQRALRRRVLAGAPSRASSPNP